MEAYLDNSATTRCYPEVGELVYKVMCEDYGNPSSMHQKGVDAEHYIKHAKEIIAKTLKVNAKDLVFTSGGTESDNLAIMGVARANRRSGNHLITSSIEHPAILNTMRHLEEEEGFRVTYLPVDENGRIRLDALREALCEDTILVSIMYVNNEVGSVQPIQEAVRIVKEYNSKILFHTDAVQGYGKYHIYPKRLGVDLLSASSHKIHGPKGNGVLYVGEKVKIVPIVYVVETVEKSVFDSMSEDDYIQSKITEWGEDFFDDITYHLKSGEQVYQKILCDKPGTLYYVVVYGLNEDGSRTTTNVTKAEFKSANPVLPPKIRIDTNTWDNTMSPRPEDNTHYDVTVFIENPVEGTELKATTTVEWIKNLTVSKVTEEQYTVSFDTGKCKHYGTPYEIKLTYGKARARTIEMY